MSEQKNIQILVVDDEPDILEILNYNLGREGYTVKTAIDAEEALHIMEFATPDLILLDIMMPGTDGVELCRIIRAKEGFEHVLIVFLTARNEDFTQITAFESGADDFINKPIKPKVLISRIKAILRRKVSSVSGQSILEFGDLRINLEQYQVTLRETNIELAKKEFQLLTLLSSKPGKVFTRQEILEYVWGVDVIVGERTIDVHIRKLREKLGLTLIKTLKGIGYKFDYK